MKLMAKQITTLPKELVGVIRGLANSGLRGVGQNVQLHTQPFFSVPTVLVFRNEV